MISARSRPEPNRASISVRILSVGDTRDGTGVVLPVQTLAVLYGTYARRHLHRWMDTARQLARRSSAHVVEPSRRLHLPRLAPASWPDDHRRTVRPGRQRWPRPLLGTATTA